MSIFSDNEGDQSRIENDTLHQFPVNKADLDPPAGFEGLPLGNNRFNGANNTTAIEPDETIESLTEESLRRREQWRAKYQDFDLSSRES